MYFNALQHFFTRMTDKRYVDKFIGVLRNLETCVHNEARKNVADLVKKEEEEDAQTAVDVMETLLKDVETKKMKKILLFEMKKKSLFEMKNKLFKTLKKNTS